MYPLWARKPMTILRKQPGLPFLLALGILLILSASFLAVQLWSDGSSRRGALHALEAPVLPKALDVSRKGNKAVSKKSNGAETVPSEVIEKPVIPVTLDSSAQVTEDNSVTPTEVVALSEETLSPKSGKADVVEKSVAVPEKAVEAAAAPVKTAIKEVKVVKSVEKTVKKAKKAKKARKVVVEEEDSLVVPPEWDWFSTPLKMEINQGQVEIVPAGSLRQVQLTSVVAKLPAGLFEPVVVEKASPIDETRTEDVASTDKPFSVAIARMAKIRQLREAREASKGVAVEADVPVASSPTMRRMGEVIKELVVKLDRQPASVATIDNSPVAVPASSEAVSSADATEPAPSAISGDAVVVPATEKDGDEGLKTADDNQFKPYYAGSGSSFSNRVNEMIRKGQYLKN